MAMVKGRIEVVVGDITGLDTDAIVNAANTSLLGGGGVDGAIHEAAGPGLLSECRRLGGCATGQAKITGGHSLRAGRVIHTVGPVWCGGDRNEEELLANCYRNSLVLAQQHNLKSVAFPAISTGAYDFPRLRACKIALVEVSAWLESHALPERVVFCCFSMPDAEIYRRVFATLP